MSSLIRALSWPLISPSIVTVEPNDVDNNGAVIVINQHTNFVKKKNGLPSPTFQQLLAARRLLCRHYYPEGGWGWIIVIVSLMVNVLTHGLQLAFGFLIHPIFIKYSGSYVNAGWLGGLSTAVALFVSPITIAVCKKKSTRLTAVIGGLVTALGCLFTSFASQFHQLFFSYGAVVGVGVGMTRDCSTLMVAQYFKRKREFVEIFVVSGSGLGLAIMSNFIKSAIDAIGWRLGLQAVTGTIFTTFILGTFYRSASLYHPQRRAILHLKNQKRKIKDKNKQDDGPPFFDLHTLRSKSVRIILLSTALSAFGINTPIFYLAHKVQLEGIGDKALILQTYLGLAWILGCFAFGLLVVRNSMECRIARQYLCQTAIFMCALCILGLTTVEGNYNGYVMFVWVYGIFCGGYHYALKMFTYEKVRARNFARAWGFVQCSQATIALGVPITGYLNQDGLGNAGYYFSAICALMGSLSLFLIDLHRRNVSKSHQHTRSNGVSHMCISEACPQRRKLSFSQEPDNEPGTLSANAAIVFGSDLLIQPINDIPLGISNGQVLGLDKPELTCISEEGIADMDLPDNLLNDFDDGMECITSSNRVENYLMMSEFENNLKAETILSKRNKFMPKTKIVLNSRDLIEHHRDGDVYLTVENHHPQNGNSNGNGHTHHHVIHNHRNNETTSTNGGSKWKLSPTEGYLGNRGISVIDEASV